MDLLSVARLLAPLAPVAASIAGGMVGGPLGAAAAGKLTSLVMGQFGINPAAPNAVGQLSDRIAEAGEETARAKINAAMEQARAEIAGFVEVEKSVNELMAKAIAQTNETIRAEDATRAQLLLAGVKEHWFFTAWRPAFGWVFLTVYGTFGLMLTAVTAKAVWGSADAFKTLAEAWPLFASYFVPGGLVLGVMIPSRSYEKGKAIENAAPMPNAKPVVPAKPALEPAKPKPGGRIPDPPGSRT